ncbi:carbonic anhydrase [Frigoribacterium sp. PhB107]|nr:carbonic anhydrase [Frigoribacterium sp. PhB107]
MPSKMPLVLALAGLTASSLFLTACSSTSDEASRQTGTPPPTGRAPAHWSYEEVGGPEAWGGLSEDYDLCASGTSQSPIDLPRTVPDLSDDVSIGTRVAPVTEADTGHASQVEVGEDGSTVRAGSRDFELLQMHAHTPAEHTVDGVAPVAEMHLVHTSDDGQLLVLSVLVDEGSASEPWQTFLDTATGPDGTTSTIDVASLLPSSLQYWSYDGSLTTPPCSEGVSGVVFSEPVTLSAEQIARLDAVHDHNARPTQGLNGRVVRGGDAMLRSE